MDSNLKKLKRGIVSVLLANIINMIINLITNFLLPKYLSVDSYAAIKTYQLYVSYAGVLSLGYVDGMYLKYGGKEFKNIDKKEFNINLSSFRILQLFISFIMLFGVILNKDIIYCFFVLTIFPINMAGYFRSLYQSIGEFKIYSNIMNLTAGVIFIINMSMIFVIKSDYYLWYLALYVAVDIVIWIVLEIYLNKSLKDKLSYTKFSLGECINNIKDGLLLMLGNFSNIIMTSMDRWFIKLLMDSRAFAQYSFACSMENFVSVAITPITVTLYNYFCKVKDIKQIRNVCRLVLLLGILLISCAFPGKFILEVYLTNYIESVDIMFYLFAAQLFYILIKGIYINLYKARKQQNRYFIKLISVIIIGFILNSICYQVCKGKEAFAIATFLSSIIWFILCIHDFPDVRFSFKELLYIIICVSTFLICGSNLSAVLGFFTYVFVSIFFAFILMNDTISVLFKVIKKLYKNK